MYDWVEKNSKSADEKSFTMLAFGSDSYSTQLKAAMATYTRPLQDQSRQNPNTLKALPLEYELLRVTLLWKHEC